MIRRIKALKDLISERETQDLPRPTMLECYTAMMPKEMRFVDLYETALGSGHSIDSAKVTLESAIETGLENGRITESEAAEWQHLIDEELLNFDNTPMHTWTYPSF